MEHIHALEHLRLLDRIHETDRTLAFVDGVLNLLTKAQIALDADTPEGRERARRLIDRAERYLPDEADLSPDAQEGFRIAASSVVAVRLALAEAEGEAVDETDDEAAAAPDAQDGGGTDGAGDGEDAG